MPRFDLKKMILINNRHEEMEKISIESNKTHEKTKYDTKPPFLHSYHSAISRDVSLQAKNL